MAIHAIRPVSNAQRHINYMRGNVTKAEPEKSLVSILRKKSGRNNTGRVTVRHQGGREKRYYREVDFKRNKRGISGKVLAFEYDPNRTSRLALIQYTDGEKRYILAPEGLRIADTVMAGENADFKVGNAMPLANVPIGVPIHNIELRVNKGGQIVKSAGSSALVQSKEGGFANILLPSGEIRRVPANCYATIGQVSNADWKNISLGKAGRKRHMGIRPSVRGVAMAPNAHPHGGGEGRSGVGMTTPKTYKGRSAVGKTRKRRKYSDMLIIKRRGSKI